MPVYNKLVRNLIPEIILKNKGTFKTRILNEKEYKLELSKKLIEESKEVLEAGNNNKNLIKEIGDVIEVLEAIEKVHKLDRKKILKLKKQRRKNRGGFEKRIFLEKTN